MGDMHMDDGITTSLVITLDGKVNGCRVICLVEEEEEQVWQPGDQYWCGWETVQGYHDGYGYQEEWCGGLGGDRAQLLNPKLQNCLTDLLEILASKYEKHLLVECGGRERG